MEKAIEMSGQNSLLHSNSSALRAAFSSLPCYDGCQQLMTVPVSQSINTTWNHPGHLQCNRTGVQIARKYQVRRRNSRNSRNGQVCGCESQPSTPCEHQNGWQMDLHIHHCPSPENCIHWVLTIAISKTSDLCPCLMEDMLFCRFSSSAFAEVQVAASWQGALNDPSIHYKKRALGVVPRMG